MSGILETIDQGLYVYSGGEYRKLLVFTPEQEKAHEDQMRVMREKMPALEKNCIKHSPFIEQQKTNTPMPGSYSRKTEMTSVRDQGSRGICCIFGMLAQHEFNWSRSQDFSEQYLQWACKARNNNDEGTWIADAWEVLRTQGVCWETTHPYTSTQPYPKWGGSDPGKAAHSQAAGYKGKQNWWLSNSDINNMKRCIYELGYVITIHVPVWWSCWPSSGEISMPSRACIEETNKVLASLTNGNEKSSPSKGEHVICLCGFNDATQRFEFKNSWNSSWGNAGYGTIPYDYIRSYGRDACIFQSA